MLTQIKVNIQSGKGTILCQFLQRKTCTALQFLTIVKTQKKYLNFGAWKISLELPAKI